MKITSSFNTSPIGTITGIILKSAQLLCLFLLIHDCLTYKQGKKHLKKAQLLKTIFFIFSTSSFFYIKQGQNTFPNEITDPIFKQIYKLVFFGYYNSGPIKFIGAVKDVKDNEYPGYFNYINRFLLEFILLIILLIWSLFLRDKVKMKGKESKEEKVKAVTEFRKIYGLFEIFIFFFSFQFGHFFLFWIIQHQNITNDNDKGADYKMFKFSYIFTWIFGIVVNLVILYFYGNLFLRKEEKSENIDVNNNPGIEKKIEEPQNDKIEEKKEEDSLGPESVRKGIYYMNIGKNKKKDINAIWFFGQFLITILAVLCNTIPRTVFILFLISDIFFGLYLIKHSALFKSQKFKFYFILSIISTFIWHLLQLIMFQFFISDVIRANGWGVFWSILLLLAYYSALASEVVICLIILFPKKMDEMELNGFGRTGSEKIKNSEDFSIEIMNVDQLKIRMEKLNKLNMMNYRPRILDDDKDNEK